MNCLENKQCFTFCQLNNEEKLKLDSIFQPPKNRKNIFYVQSGVYYIFRIKQRNLFLMLISPFFI